MSNNTNNRMSQQQTMSQNQWYPNMNPYGFYGVNQFGFTGYGGPPGPFFPQGGFYPSQMPGGPNNIMNYQQNSPQMQMKGFVSGGLSKKQRSKLRKRLAKEALEKQQQPPSNSFQPPLPPGPPPPPGSAPPPPQQGGGSNTQPVSLPSPVPEKQNNYKSILNSSLMGDWPDSLRSYISRALERCQTDTDEQRVTKQLQNKITAAVNSNMLYIKDWNSEPLPVTENELSNVTIKPFQFNNKTHNNLNLSPSSPFHQNNRPNSSLKQRLGAMSSQSEEEKVSQRSNSQPDKKYQRNGDRYGRKRKSSSSSSSSTPGGASDNESADYIPLNSSNSNSSSKKNKKSKYENTNRTNKKSSSVDPNFSNVESDEALLRKRAARFNDSTNSNARKSSISTTSFSVNFDSFDMIGRGGGEDAEFDLSSCHVVGTCRDLEKQFFRLTAAPESAMVRPPQVLEKSLRHVKQRWDQNKDIVWTTSQLKSIRQDLTVRSNAVSSSLLSKTSRG
ncbi:hypothetical protein WDU94_003037 [Cyamophila willieti]